MIKTAPAPGVEHTCSLGAQMGSGSRCNSYLALRKELPGLVWTNWDLPSGSREEMTGTKPFRQGKGSKDIVLTESVCKTRIHLSQSTGNKG